MAEGGVQGFQSTKEEQMATDLELENTGEIMSASQVMEPIGELSEEEKIQRFLEKSKRYSLGSCNIYICI